MLRNHPLLGRALSLIIIGLYLAALYFLLTTLLPSARGLSFGAASAANRRSPSSVSINQQIMVTRDSGANWSNLRIGDNNFLNSLYCPGTNTCYAFGYSMSAPDGEGGTSIFVTSDGGKNWTSQKVAVYSDEDESGLDGISCPQPAHCFVLGTGKKGISLLETVDSGKNWQTLNDNIADWDLVDLDCPTETSCFAVGQEGKILHSSDGGKNWQAQDSGSDRTLYDLSCISALRCVAIGRSATVVMTNDGGQTWTRKKISSNESLTKLHCLSTSDCFALGYAAKTRTKLFASHDGGNSWAEVDAGLDDNFGGFSCPDAQHCLTISSNNGLNLLTATGDNWRAQKLNSEKKLYMLSCPTISSCYTLTYPDFQG